MWLMVYNFEVVRLNALGRKSRPTKYLNLILSNMNLLDSDQYTKNTNLRLCNNFAFRSGSAVNIWKLQKYFKNVTNRRKQEIFLCYKMDLFSGLQGRYPKIWGNITKPVIKLIFDTWGFLWSWFQILSISQYQNY